MFATPQVLFEPHDGGTTRVAGFFFLRSLLSFYFLIAAPDGDFLTAALVVPAADSLLLSLLESWTKDNENAPPPELRNGYPNRLHANGVPIAGLACGLTSALSWYCS